MTTTIDIGTLISTKLGDGVILPAMENPSA
jgi:hypothetical protein